MRPRAAALVLVTIIALACCNRKEQQDTPAPAAPAHNSALRATPAEPARVSGWYRVVLDRADDKIDEIPFLTWIPAPGDDDSLKIKQGFGDSEFDHRWSEDGSVLAVEFPMFMSRLEGKVIGDRLEGSFTSSSPVFGTSSIDMVAIPVDEPTAATWFPQLVGAAPKLDTFWDISFGQGDRARLELEFRGGTGLVAMLTFATGNRVYLGGRAAGDEIRLASFDGSSPYLLTARVSGPGLIGHWSSGARLDWNDDFTATVARGAFTAGPSVEKNATFEIPGVDLGRYRGRALVVQIASGWCVSCKYQSPHLVDLYVRYKAQGLSMVTLTYEFTDDREFNEARARRFKDDYDIPWDVIPVHGGFDSAAKILPDSLSGMDLGGLPFTVFVRPDLTVQSAIGGFPSAQARRQQSEAIAQLDAEVRRLITDLAGN